jgi:hypothetical protein
MRRWRDIEREYHSVCLALSRLSAADTTDAVVALQLLSIKKTLEWTYPRLIKTRGSGRVRWKELMEHRHFVIGPTEDLLTP